MVHINTILVHVNASMIVHSLVYRIQTPRSLTRSGLVALWLCGSVVVRVQARKQQRSNITRVVNHQKSLMFQGRGLRAKEATLSKDIAVPLRTSAQAPRVHPLSAAAVAEDF